MAQVTWEKYTAQVTWEKNMARVDLEEIHGNLEEVGI